MKRYEDAEGLQARALSPTPSPLGYPFMLEEKPLVITLDIPAVPMTASQVPLETRVQDPLTSSCLME